MNKQLLANTTTSIELHFMILFSTIRYNNRNIVYLMKWRTYLSTINNLRKVLWINSWDVIQYLYWYFPEACLLTIICSVGLKHKWNFFCDFFIAKFSIILPPAGSYLMEVSCILPGDYIPLVCYGVHWISLHLGTLFLPLSHCKILPKLYLHKPFLITAASTKMSNSTTSISIISLFYI